MPVKPSNSSESNVGIYNSLKNIVSNGWETAKTHPIKTAIAATVGVAYFNRPVYDRAIEMLVNVVTSPEAAIVERVASLSRSTIEVISFYYTMNGLSQ